MPSRRRAAPAVAADRAASPAAGAESPGRGLRWFAAGWALTQFVVMSVYSVRYHELWRDEIQAWLIARDTDVSGFFTALRYEGHPGFWHLMLVPLAKGGLPVQTMQVLAAAIAAASSWVFLRFAPFPLWLRLLFTVSYLQLYEWGVLSRNYGLGALCILVWCVLVTRPRVRWTAVALALALISQTSVVAALLVPPLCLYSVLRAWSEHGGRRAARAPGLDRDLVRRVLGLAFTAGAGMVVMYLQTRPEPDNAHISSGDPWSLLPDDMFNAFVPIGHGGVFFWMTHAFEGKPWGPILVTILVTAGALWVLRSNPAACLTYGFGYVLLSAFFHIRYPGSLRHQGFYELLLVVCLWLVLAHRRPARRAVRSRWGTVPVVGLAAVILGTQAVGSVVALDGDRKERFSDAKAAAEAIEAPRFAGYDLLFVGDFETSPILGYLGRRTTYVNTGETSYIVWNKDRVAAEAKDPSAQDVVRAATAMYARDRKPILVVSYTGLASKVLKLAGAVNQMPTISEERYLLYTYTGSAAG